MALIIPEDSLTASYPGPELHESVQQLSEEFVARQQLSSDINVTGLRYWVSHDKRSVLIATLPEETFGTSFVDHQLLHQHPLVFELIQERNALLPELLQEHASRLLPILLILPDNLKIKQTIQLKEQGLLAIGGIALEGALPAVLSKYIGMAASEQVNKIIRSRFNPQLRLDKQQKQTEENKLATLLPDVEQELSMTSDWDITTSSLPYSLRLILGSSGSGKSTVLINRAAMLVDKYPRAKILVLTHNKAISNELKQQLTNIGKKTHGIQCLPFLEWCRKLLGGTRQFVYEDQETELFDLMIKRHFEETGLSRFGLIKEINFIKDRMIETEAEYLATLRSGQSLALSNPVRKRIWQAMVEVDTHLKDRNSHLWADAPAILLKEFEEGKTFEPFQHILIDEAQYFAPSWIKVIKHALANESQLFLTSDPDQGFYNRSLEWKETGLDFRGRTIRLKHHYRCSPAISRVVDTLWLHRLMEQAQHPLYSINHIDPIQPEDHPQLLHFPTQEDQKTRLFSEINQLLKQDYKPGDILVLNADKQSTRFMAQDIREALNIKATTLTGSMSMDTENLRLCDLEAATGIESKIVFITGLEKLFDMEADNKVSERERHSLRITNTHLLHMAMTRASEKLYLLLTTNTIPEAFNIEGLDIPTLSTTDRAPVMYINQ
ncbi:UvrD-helicase domain-containing protein [Leucothrix pacifica]|nr:UvrD-helicase domain-containing protein [Leucothrix pacifica]